MPKINSPSVFINHTHDDLDSANPSSLQDVCDISTQSNDLALLEFS